jgi:hypothetical protein
MTEQSPNVEHQTGTGRGSPPGMPRWVKIAAIIVGVLILLFVILQLTGIGGEHGPGRHMSGSAPQSALVDGWAPPAGTAT